MSDREEYEDDYERRERDEDDESRSSRKERKRERRRERERRERDNDGERGRERDNDGERERGHEDKTENQVNREKYENYERHEEPRESREESREQVQVQIREQPRQKISSESNVMNRLKDFLKKNNYIIVETYSIDEYCKYIKINSTTKGNTIIVSVPSKYNILDEKSISLVPVEIGKARYEDAEEYDKIKSDTLAHTYIDPEDVDKMMSVDYKNINIEEDKDNKIRRELSEIKNQMNRLKNCTVDIKYKLCIETDECYCIINSKNKIKCFKKKNAKYALDEDDEYSNTKKIFISIDMESFYDNINTVYSDCKKVEDELYSILNKSHSSHVDLIKNYMKQFDNIREQISVKYDRRKKYSKAISDLESKIKSLNKREKNAEEDLKLQLPTASSLVTFNDASKAFKTKSLNDELEAIAKLKREAISLLNDVKDGYNTFILEFENTLIENIILLKNVSANFKRIGIR
jgi:hypothetical protein